MLAHRQSRRRPAQLAFLALRHQPRQRLFRRLVLLLAVVLMIRAGRIGLSGRADLSRTICIAVVRRRYLGLRCRLVLSFQTRVPSVPRSSLASVLYIVFLPVSAASALVRQLFPGRHLES